jgi:hypothetical protein
VNFRKLLMWTIGAALVVFLGEMLLFKLGAAKTPKDMLEIFSVLCTLLLVIASFVLISSIVSSIKEKRKREAFLMLPSTNLEKYLSLVAYTTVISIACIFLAIVVGDSLRMLWLWASGYSNEMMNTTIPTRHNGETYYWYSSAIPQVLHNLTPHITSNGDTYTINDGKYKIVYMCTNGYLIARHVMIAAFYVWIHSLFTFCGTLLRKYAFVVSGILVFFALWLNGWAEHFGFGLYDHQYYQEYGREGFDQFETVVNMVNTSIASVVLLLLTSLTIFNYWASFHIFKGFQLITNKWTNYDILKR